MVNACEFDGVWKTGNQHGRLGTIHSCGVALGVPYLPPETKMCIISLWMGRCSLYGGVGVHSASSQLGVFGEDQIRDNCAPSQPVELLYSSSTH